MSTSKAVFILGAIALYHVQVRLSPLSTPLLVRFHISNVVLYPSTLASSTTPHLFMLSLHLHILRFRRREAPFRNTFLNSSPLPCFSTVAFTLANCTQIHMIRTRDPFSSGLEYGSTNGARVRYAVFTLIKCTGLWGQVYSDLGPGP